MTEWPDTFHDDGRCPCGFDKGQCNPYRGDCLYAPYTPSPKVTVVEITPGCFASLIQMPYHEGDIYDRLLGRDAPTVNSSGDCATGTTTGTESHGTVPWPDSSEGKPS